MSSSVASLPPLNKRGVVLVNVGTPDATDTGSVRRYLREFLSDPRVIDIHPVARWLLLNLIILPTRPRKSAEAYRKVWTPEGSPLLTNSRAFENALARNLGGDFEVVLAMRYGNPSIRQALETLKARGVTEIVLFPLYPQYAASSTGTSLERIYEELSGWWNIPSVRVVPPFFNTPEFVKAFVEVAKPVIATHRSDHVLFSFHGLPERQIRKSDETQSHCLATDRCCDALTSANRYCYRAQSFHTARTLAAQLGLSPSGYSVSFQSRLGRTPWIRPYTDIVLPELAKRGIRRVAVVCPAFVADCLETLEEVALRAKELFVSSGGEDLVLVPSLNAHPAWVQGAAQLVRRA
jgi:ferrochelatase